MSRTFLPGLFFGRKIIFFYSICLLILIIFIKSSSPTILVVAQSLKEKADIILPTINIDIKENKVISLVVDEDILNEIHADNLPLELIILPKECFSNKQKLKEDIINGTLCEDALTISINDLGTYDFSPLKESLFVIYSCKNKGQGCEDDPNNIKVGFISNRYFTSSEKNSEKVNLNQVNDLQAL